MYYLSYSLQSGPPFTQSNKNSIGLLIGFIYKHAEDKSSWRAVVLSIYAT